MSKLNFNRSWQSGVLSLLALLGVASMATEEAVAKIAVVRKTTSAAMSPKRLGGSSSTNQEFALYCEGYPVLIKEVDGKTLVYVKDDYANDPIDSEKYLVEGDILWSRATIYAGGHIGSSQRSVSVEMNGGEVGEIILAGDSPNDQVNGDATLTVSGGTVGMISIMGPWFSGVNGSVNISLSDMVYGGSRRISEDKRVEFSDDENGWPIYYSDDVTITYNGCKFSNPWADPDHVDPWADPNIFDTNCMGSVAGLVAAHDYYIANIVPDEDFVDAGVATVKCKHCDKEWVITFGAYGGYTIKDLSAYSYCVELASTLVPPTCVPGRGIYRLVLKINQTEITGEYESEIPPVDGVHNWGDDGICHEDHYETEMNPDGSVSHDEFGNIKYKLLDGAMIKKHLEEKERTLTYSYLRAGRKNSYFAGSNFSKLKRVVWDIERFDTPLSALTRGMISRDFLQNDVVIGFNEDVVLDGDFGPEPSPVAQLDSARFINLHGHVLDAADHKLGVSGALTIMNGEVKNAEIFSLADAPLTLDNAIFTSNKVEWPGTRGILLLNGSKMDSSNVVSSDNVQMDETSAAITKFDLNGDGKVDISDVTKLIDFILKK